METVGEYAQCHLFTRLPFAYSRSNKGKPGRPFLEEAWRTILGRLACLPAIKAGHRLLRSDAQSLLNALRQCETPWVCPHREARTALVLSELELARKFGRRNSRAVNREYKES